MRLHTEPAPKIAVSVLIASSLALSSCTFASGDSDNAALSGISASRLKLYNGLPALVADSQVVLVGEAIAQSTTDGDIGFNGEVFTPPQTETVLTVRNDVDVSVELGATGLVDVGADEVVVRQTGTPDMDETPAALLEVGETYLLFLTLVDDGGTYSTPTYYVVGSSAGLYQGDDGGLPFLNDDPDRFVTLGDDGDRLPELVETTATDDSVILGPGS